MVVTVLKVSKSVTGPLYMKIYKCYYLQRIEEHMIYTVTIQF